MDSPMSRRGLFFVPILGSNLACQAGNFPKSGFLGGVGLISGRDWAVGGWRYGDALQSFHLGSRPEIWRGPGGV